MQLERRDFREACERRAVLLADFRRVMDDAGKQPVKWSLRGAERCALAITVQKDDALGPAVECDVEPRAIEDYRLLAVEVDRGPACKIREEIDGGIAQADARRMP